MSSLLDNYKENKDELPKEVIEKYIKDGIKKMEKEFNLSEKIFVPIERYKKITFIPVKDVKEFIRKLLEVWTNVPDDEFPDMVKKLAGDKLI